VKFKIKSDMRFSHPEAGKAQNFRILEKGTIITALAPSEMTDEELGSIQGMRKRDPHNKRRIGFKWLGRFRTGIIGDDLSPCHSSGVISKRNW